MRNVLILLVISISILSISCKKDDGPESIVTILQGIEVENGLYRNVSERGDTNDYVFSGTNNVNHRLYNGDVEFKYTGTWNREDILFSYNFEAHTEQANTLFFKRDGITYFIYGACEKVSGNMNELVGEYKGAFNIFFKDEDEEDSETTTVVNISEDGSYKVTMLEEDGVFISGTWSIEEIKNGDFFFIDYKGKRFVVIKDFPLYKKQE